MIGKSKAPATTYEKLTGSLWQARSLASALADEYRRKDDTREQAALDLMVKINQLFNEASGLAYAKQER